MSQIIFLIQRIGQILILSLVAIALQMFMATNTNYSLNNMAIADITMSTTIPKIVAYDIDQEFDQQRKQETQKHHGEEVGKIVDDAIKNNRESPPDKIEREDPLNKKVGKFFRQIKEKGLIDVEQENHS